MDSSFLTSVNKQVGDTNRWLRNYQAGQAAADAETDTKNGDSGTGTDTNTPNSGYSDFPWSDLLNMSGTSGMMMPMLMLMLLQMMMSAMQSSTQADPFQGFPVYWPNGPLTSLVPPVINPFGTVNQSAGNV